MSQNLGHGLGHIWAWAGSHLDMPLHVCMSYPGQCRLCLLTVCVFMFTLSLKHLSYSRITPRSSNISISLNHSKPVLTGEYYDVAVSICNKEATAITNVRIMLSLPDSFDELEPAGGFV